MDGGLSVQQPSEDRQNVVYLRPADARAARRRRVVSLVAEYGLDVARGVRRCLVLVWMVVWQAVRLVLYTVLVLAEPIVRIILVPIAMLGFVVTLLFGFLIGDPAFPKWGMLAFSMCALWLYWLFLGLIRLLMRLS